MDTVDDQQGHAPDTKSLAAFGDGDARRCANPGICAMQCCLCKQESGKLVKAHIFPRGFFSPLTTKGRLNTLKASGDRGRKLQSAIYDPDILCQDCEHDIIQPLDDYAIRVIRDKSTASKVDVPKQAAMGLWYFDKVNKRKLRAFLASVLWRCSVSRQLELRELSIGAAFEHRIGKDLKSDGDFLYVDMVLFYLKDPLHSAFLIPYQKTLRPLDPNRDREPAGGWVLQFPNISITVSLDDRLHPHRIFLELDPDLTGRPTHTLVSTSLHTEAKKYRLLAFEAPRQENVIQSILSGIYEIGDIRL